jgi:HK97 family phage major capsid protein
MQTITQDREEIRAAMKRLTDIEAKAMAEGRNLNTTEVAYMKEINAEIESMHDMITTRENRERLSMQLEAPTAPPVTVKNIPRPVEAVKKDRFHSLGENMIAIMNAGLPGRNVDPRLFNAALGLNETIPSEGGFLVQQDFSTEMLQEVFATGILAPRCRRIQVSGNANSIKINGVDETSRASTRSGGILGYWAGEATEKTKSKPKFREIDLTLNKLVGLCYATDELLQDASALESFIRSAFVSEFGFLIDDAIINGSGAGMPLGILNSGCLVQVDKETGQKADTVVFENVIKMWSRLFPASQANSIFLINNNVFPQLFQMSMSVGTGGVPVYMPAGGINNAPYGTLFGRPVIAIEQCPTVGDMGDIILADMSGYILAEKGGISSDMSIHSRFEYDESVFRFVTRLAGQPVRASALTPYKGSSTLSHFVALQARA